MVNENKVRLMTQIAIYEKHEGRQYLPVSKYYRSDYIGLALIKNFFIVTFGYVMILACLAVYYLEYLLNNIHRMNLLILGSELLIGYALMLIVFSVFTYVQYSVRYYLAKQSLTDYYQMLTDLNKQYHDDQQDE